MFVKMSNVLGSISEQSLCSQEFVRTSSMYSFLVRESLGSEISNSGQSMKVSVGGVFESLWIAWTTYG